MRLLPWIRVLRKIKPQVRDLLLFLPFGIISHGIEGFLL